MAPEPTPAPGGGPQPANEPGRPREFDPALELAPAAPGATGVVRGRATRWELLAVFVLALALVVAWWHQAWAAPGSTQVGGLGDAQEYSWFLGWVPWAIGHGVNPLISTYVNYPHGVNLLWNTSVVLPAFIMSPVTSLFGAAFSYNVLISLAPTLATLFGYMAFRRWAGRVPSLVGALIFGFSPYMAAQSLGHLAQVLLMCAPLLLIAMDRLLNVQSSTAWRDGLLLGGVVWAQLLISEETLAMEAVVALGVVVILVLAGRALIPDTRYAERGLAVGAVTFVVLAAPFLAYQFLGPYRVQGAHPANQYVSDLLNFVVPTSFTRFAPASWLTVSAHFTGNNVEQDAYIGVPLLLVLVASFALRRKCSVAWMGAAVTVVAGALSLGSTLHVDGHISSLPMPGWVLQHLPVLRNLLPGRFAGLMFLGVGLLVALGLDGLSALNPAWRTSGWALTAIGVFAIVPTTNYIVSPSPGDPAFTSGWACPSGPGPQGRPPVALVVPSQNELTLLWQEEAKFCFAMPSDRGMTGSNAGDVGNLRLLLNVGQGELAPPPLTPAVRRQAAGDLAALHIKEVIVIPEYPASPAWSPLNQAQVVAWFEQLLGRKPLPYREPYFAYAWKHLPPLSQVTSGDFGKHG